MPRLQVLDIVETYDSSGRSEITLFGRDESNCASSIRILNTPYNISVAIGEDFHALDVLKDELNAQLLASPPRCRKYGCHCQGDQFGIYREPCVYERKHLSQAVSKVEKVMRYGFDVYEPTKRSFATFTLTQSYLFNSANRFLQKANVGKVLSENAGVHGKVPDGVSSFLLAKKLAGFDWVSFPDSPVVEFDDVKVIPTSETKGATFIAFFFDIEVIAQKYTKLETAAAAYPVGLISASTSSGQKRTFLLASPSTPEDDPRPNQTVYQTEVELLTAFRDFFLASDPDFVSGYNTNGYDTPYLIRRARKLNIKHYEYLSRLPSEPLVFRTTLTVKNSGSSETTIIDCPGRVLIDLLPLVVNANFKLESNKLNDVAVHLKLGEKDDIDGYDNIWPMFHGDRSTRANLAKYCERDVELPMLIEQRMDLIRSLMAKCGVLRLRPRDALERGLGFQLTTKVRTCIDGEYLMAAKVMGSGKENDEYFEEPVEREEDDYFEDNDPKRGTVEPKGKKRERPMSRVERADDKDRRRVTKEPKKKKTKTYTKPRTNELLRPSFASIDGYAKLWHDTNKGEKYPGAFVVPPVVGFHDCCVGTLDFSSLYPSIASSHNICRTTQLKRKRENDCYTSPCGYSFVTVNVRKGVIPSIMDELLVERTAVRVDEDQETEPNRKAMLKARQTELKLAANALYGQLGAITSELCAINCAYSITSIGQEYIQKVCMRLESEPEFEQYGLQVIYGDTDSVFIALTKVRDPVEGGRIMTMLENWVNVVSGIMPVGKKMRMAYENLSYPFLSLAKKVYVKCLWNKKLQKWEIKKSGLGTRSMTKYAKSVLDKILHLVMVERCSQETLEAELKNAFGMLWRGEVSSELLKHSANLSKALKEYDTETPHVRAGRQLESVGIDVKIGERIPYGFCNVPVSKKNKKAERSVAWALIKKGGYTLHYQSYVDEMMGSFEKSILYFIAGDTMEAKLRRLQKIAYEQPKTVFNNRSRPTVSGLFDKFVEQCTPHVVREREAAEATSHATTKVLHQIALSFTQAPTQPSQGIKRFIAPPENTKRVKQSNISDFFKL